jgi:photosystem II stability/assembly factor-like uncharacterized protein
MNDLRSNLRNRIGRERSKVCLSLAAIRLTCVLALTATAAYPAHNDTGGPSAWRSNGPQEAIYALAIDPINPNVIYAGARSGVLKSTDGGASWKNTGLTHVTLSLAIDYTNPNIIYAGASPTGLVVAPGKPSLWKSTDGGATWSDMGVIDWDISLLVIDPNSPTTLYAGSLFGYQEEGSINLWRTTDGGVSWDRSWWNHRVGTGVLGLSTYGWAINPAEPQTIYAAGDLYFHASLDFDPGLFKSTDGGASWNSTGLIDTFATATAIDPSNPKTLYAGTATNGRDDLGFRGLLKSTDAGASWFAINTGLSHLLGTSSHISSLIIDPLDPNILYAGTLGCGVFRSANGGASWSQFNPGLTNLVLNKLAIDISGKQLYAATNLGVFDYQFATTCVEPLSAERESFEAVGGTGSVKVSTANGCRWSAVSYADWISITSGAINDGSGTVSYSVGHNRSGPPRVGTIEIAARFFTVTQAGAPLRITGVSVRGKKLHVTGEGFDSGAVILLNGQKQKTRNDDRNPGIALIGKKTGKRIKPGDRLQVRNADGTTSEEFTFTGF